MEIRNKKYWALVLKCRPLVEKNKQMQNDVARLTIQARRIVKEFTFKVFAKDIGLSKSTLNRWVVEYERVYQKLDLPKDKALNKEVVKAVLRRVGKNSTVSETRKILNQELKKRESKEDQVACGYVQRLREVSFNVNHGWVLKNMNRTNLEKMHIVATELLTGLDNFLYDDPGNVDSLTKNTCETMDVIKKALQ